MKITLEDLCRRCGDYTDEPNDDFCECGNRLARDCTGITGRCYLMPEAPDERWPSAEVRWWRGIP